MKVSSVVISTILLALSLVSVDSRVSRKVRLSKNAEGSCGGAGAPG